MPRIRFTLMALACVMLGGASCGALDFRNPEYSWSGGGRVTTAGANQLIDHESFEPINLPAVLDPDGRAKRSLKEPDTWDSLKGDEKLQRAFEAFYTYDDPEQRRNRTQDRMLAASEQRCNVYKNYLKRVDSRANFWLGTLTTVLGGAGAIVTGVDAARALAGSAGIFSGIRAEFQQEYLANTAINVITKGIETRRKGLFEEIQKVRKKAIQDYTAEAAVKDALIYHGACSLIAGLEQAGTAIERIEDPGLATMNRALINLQVTKQILEGKITADSDLISLSPVRLVSPGATISLSSSDPLRAFYQAKERRDLDRPSHKGNG